MNTARKKGFTLIEMMIVVAIIGILAAIAYPSYQQQIRQSRRADAQAALVSLAGAMERIFSQSNSYTIGGVAPALGACPTCIFPAQVPTDLPAAQAAAQATYTLAIDYPVPPGFLGFRLTATPAGAQAGDGALTLLHTGARNWDQNANGANDAGENDWAR